jgi:hypothetical protein
MNNRTMPHQWQGRHVVMGCHDLRLNRAVVEVEGWFDQFYGTSFSDLLEDNPEVPDDRNLALLVVMYAKRAMAFGMPKDNNILRCRLVYPNPYPNNEVRLLVNDVEIIGPVDNQQDDLIMPSYAEFRREMTGNTNPLIPNVGEHPLFHKEAHQLSGSEFGKFKVIDWVNRVAALAIGGMKEEDYYRLYDCSLILGRIAKKRKLGPEKANDFVAVWNSETGQLFPMENSVIDIEMQLASM